MESGKVITLFLKNGNINGIVIGNLGNWIGQVIKAPRNEIQNLKEITEINRAGIYFLFNKKNSNNTNLEIYIGESENVYNRILQHIKDDNKQFFNEIIAFTSKEDELNKTDIKYLEARLVEEISENDKYFLKNKNLNMKPKVKQLTAFILEEYLKNIKIMLPTLGYDLFFSKDKIKTVKEKIITLEFKEQNINEKKIAKAILLENGKILVLKGSPIKKEIQSSLSNGYRKKRENLIQSKIINKEKFEFNMDYEFSSPSAAAAIILGIAVNGRKKWNFEGKTIEHLEKN